MKKLLLLSALFILARTDDDRNKNKDDKIILSTNFGT